LKSRVLGLSATKHSILGQLYRCGPTTPKALAFGVQPQSLTRVLAELEESSLVLRKQDKSESPVESSQTILEMPLHQCAACGQT